MLLRSQTSTVQIRTMETTKPPVRIVSLGRVYRPDAIDATHSCMFHQMEGLMVDRHVTMAQLKTVLSLFARVSGAGGGDSISTIILPFTEPSVEVDMKWGIHGWKSAERAWLNRMSSKLWAMTRPKVSGFAFGLGIERFCMKHYGVDDIRRFYENDIRFLSQF